VDITPDPRNTSVSTAEITFSENVTGVDISDFTLTRNGSPVTISGLTVTQVNAADYTINLSTVTGTAGTYVLTLVASGSGIKDAANNVLVTNASDAWITNATAPTADIVDVTPDPRNTAVNTIEVTFSKNVTGVGISDFTLTRNGSPVDISGLTVTQVNAADYTINLSTVTGTAGTYVLTLVASGSGIQDTAANALAVNASDTWVTDLTGERGDGKVLGGGSERDPEQLFAERDEPGDAGDGDHDHPVLRQYVRDRRVAGL
jgi:hypothetical protein